MLQVVIKIYNFVSNIIIILIAGITIKLMKQGEMLTILSTLVDSLAWIFALLSATNFIDRKWSIVMDRFVYF